MAQFWYAKVEVSASYHFQETYNMDTVISGRPYFLEKNEYPRFAIHY